MIKLAVRVVKAFPEVAKKAAVPALEIAAKVEGTEMPSNPWPKTPSIPSMVVVAEAPVIWNAPRTLPPRSVTATVALTPLFTDSVTACAIIVRTSSAVSGLAVVNEGLPKP